MPPCLVKNPMSSCEQHGHTRVLVVQAGDKVHGPFAGMSASYREAATPAHRVSRRCSHSLLTCPLLRTGAEPMKHLVPIVANRKSQGGSLR